MLGAARRTDRLAAGDAAGAAVHLHDAAVGKLMVLTS